MTIITVLTCRLWSFQQLARAGERLSIRAGQLTLANWLKLASRLALTSTVYTFNNTNTAGACLELRIVFRLLTVRWRRIVIQKTNKQRRSPSFVIEGTVVNFTRLLVLLLLLQFTPSEKKRQGQLQIPASHR